MDVYDELSFFYFVLGAATVCCLCCTHTKTECFFISLTGAAPLISHSRSPDYEWKDFGVLFKNLPFCVRLATRRTGMFFLAQDWFFHWKRLESVFDYIFLTLTIGVPATALIFACCVVPLVGRSLGNVFTLPWVGNPAPLMPFDNFAGSCSPFDNFGGIPVCVYVNCSFPDCEFWFSAASRPWREFKLV